jgi:hypothetical protein
MKSMKTIHSITVFICALLLSAAATAQPRHQFSIHAGGGISTFDYRAAAGKGYFGFSGTLGLDYTYFFDASWGISTGVSAYLLNGKHKFAAFSETYPSHDGEEDFAFTYTVKNYSENQQAVLLTIPLMLRMETGLFYAAAGGKIGIPLNAGYKNRADELQTSGYFSQSDLTLHHPAFMGFGTFNNIGGNDDLKLAPAFFIAVEAGFRWDRFFAGFYLDFSLTGMRKAPEQPQHLIPYTLPEPSDYRPNSIFTASTGGKDFVDTIAPLMAGIKVGLIIGGNNKPKSCNCRYD